MRYHHVTRLVRVLELVMRAGHMDFQPAFLFQSADNGLAVHGDLLYTQVHTRRSGRGNSGAAILTSARDDGQQRAGHRKANPTPKSGYPKKTARQGRAV